jgi:hypothetical protein
VGWFLILEIEMRDEELKRDMEKFCAYLNANGVTVLCGHLTAQNADGTRFSITAGDPDWIGWGLATSMLAAKGYEVRRT